MVVDNAFDIGDVVYLRSDVDQAPGLVIAFTVLGSQQLTYTIAFGPESYVAYEIELTKDKTITIGL